MKKSDAHSAYPSPTVTQHIQKEQPQPSTPSTTEQESRPNAVNREKTAQPPVRKKLKESDNKIPTTNSEAKPTAIRRDNQEQPALEKQQPKRPAANKQIKAVQSSQVTNKSDSRPARPSNTAAQPRTAKQQSRSRSVARETVHEPTKVNATQNHRETQGQTLQKDAKIEQGNGSQSHQEIQQSRPRGEQRRPR